MNDGLEHEVEDIVERTRVVPITMIAGVLLTLILFAAVALAVYRDTDDGSLADEQGLVDEADLDDPPQTAP